MKKNQYKDGSQLQPPQSTKLCVKAQWTSTLSNQALRRISKKEPRSHEILATIKNTKNTGISSKVSTNRAVRSWRRKSILWLLMTLTRRARQRSRVTSYRWSDPQSIRISRRMSCFTLLDCRSRSDHMRMRRRWGTLSKIHHCLFKSFESWSLQRINISILNLASENNNY